VVYRALGWLFLAAAVAVAVRDALSWWFDAALHLMSLGELWSHLAGGSLSDARTAVQGHLSSGAWTWVVRPGLSIPAVAAFLVLAILLLRLGHRAAPAEPGLLTGSRPSRRRRSRGGLS
jgi:hypothetical protein